MGGCKVREMLSLYNYGLVHTCHMLHELLKALMLSLTKNKINSFSIKAPLWQNASVHLVLDNTGSKKITACRQKEFSS